MLMQSLGREKERERERERVRRKERERTSITTQQVTHARERPNLSQPTSLPFPVL